MKIKIFSNKISINLLITVVLCFFLSISLSLIAMRYVSFKYYDATVAYDYNNMKYINLLMICLVIVGIAIFIFSFLLIINKKIKYLKYITKGVKKIADEDFGYKIEVNGRDELAQLCTSINSMSTQLKSVFDSERELENTKAEFITNMSHDLRSPLTSIIGYADLIRKKKYKDDVELHEFAEVTYSKCERLKKLIDELFEYTKLNSEGVQLNFSNVNLSGIIAQLTGEYIPAFETEGLTICRNIPKEDIIVNADIEKIVRVFDNILINAMKYSVKPSEVFVEIHKYELGVVVSISNKVDNLQVDDLDKLFERFYRGDKSRNEDGGTGIGLAIAKRIIELHHGKIWAEYKENNIILNVELLASK